MRVITTLDPSVRLVVFQFLMKSAQVPAIIPPKRVSNAPPAPRVSGVQVLESTPSLNIAPLTDHLVIFGNYQLVDVWQDPHETKWGTSFVRFVFCPKEHVKSDELFPKFVAQKYGLEKVFSNMVTANLWATQGHLNPYFEDGKTTGHQVLMLGCAGRVPNTLVFSGGRDENNRGIGPKVHLSTLSSKLNLSNNGDVVLVVPEPISAPTPDDEEGEDPNHLDDDELDLDDKTV